MATGIALPWNHSPEPVSSGSHGCCPTSDLTFATGGNPLPPQGFPSLINGPSVWSGNSSGLFKPYIVDLAAHDVAEIEQAVAYFKGLELDGDDVTRDRFPLPHLAGPLQQGALEIHQGSGLCIIRGLDPQDYSVEDNTLIFLGISCYLGGQRGVQSSKGAMLSHITESKSWTVPRAKRHGIHTNDSLPFHCDMGCEILSIQVRQCAQAGGRTCVASSAAIYNDLLRSDPAAVHVLATPDWPIQASSKHGRPYFLSPLIDFHDGNLLLSMDPARIGPRVSNPAGSVPPLNAQQRAALAALQASAAKHQVALQNQPGDLIYINNWSLLHAREAYEDGSKTSRHLVRLWLRNEDLGWAIPESMRVPWESSFGRHAKLVRDRLYPLAPMPEYMASKYTNGTAAFIAD